MRVAVVLSMTLNARPPKMMPAGMSTWRAKVPPCMSAAHMPLCLPYACAQAHLWHQWFWFRGFVNASQYPCGRKCTRERRVMADIDSLIVLLLLNHSLCIILYRPPSPVIIRPTRLVSFSEGGEAIQLNLRNSIHGSLTIPNPGI